jgi:phosphomannomutase
MLAARNASSATNPALLKELDAIYPPTHEKLHLNQEQKSVNIQKSKTDVSILLGRKIKSIDRADGAKFAFEDGSWILLRLSGTEPLLRLYVEAETPAASIKLVREATNWILSS